MDEHVVDSAELAGISPEVHDLLSEDVMRIKVRMDYFPRLGELDFSLVARSFPGGAVVRNKLWSWYDVGHMGMAAPDLVSHLYSTLKVFPEPF